MPKKITSVLWSASNLPSGLSFDTTTGTFSGTAATTGEYTVTVSVKTNYGEDSKDVKISIVNAYSVYAIGSSAARWSENAEADEYGFRKLNMPNATKLLNHPSGFGAKVSGGDYYCCGIVTIASNAPYYDGYTMATTPLCLTITDLKGRRNVGTDTFWGAAYLDYADYEIDDVCLINYSNPSKSQYHIQTSIDEKHIIYVKLSKNNDEIILTIPSMEHKYVTYNNGQNPYSWDSAFQQTHIIQGHAPYQLLSPCIPVKYLSDTMKEWIIGLEDNGSSLVADGQISDLGFRAIKIFAPYLYTRVTKTSSTGNITASANYAPLVQYFSEDHLLDNDASKFTLGTIRDVWCYQRRACVVTEDNKLYDAISKTYAYTYTSDKYEWVLQGDFDVKKIEIYTETLAFMLTNDGKLYHKGTAVANVTEAHTNFTQIFPDCYIHDFTFNGNTLTVLKN